MAKIKRKLNTRICWNCSKKHLKILSICPKCNEYVKPGLIGYVPVGKKSKKLLNAHRKEKARLSNKRRLKMIELRAKGWTLQQIGVLYLMSKEGVRKILKNEGN